MRQPTDDVEGLLAKSSWKVRADDFRRCLAQQLMTLDGERLEIEGRRAQLVVLIDFFLLLSFTDGLSGQ